MSIKKFNLTEEEWGTLPEHKQRFLTVVRAKELYSFIQDSLSEIKFPFAVLSKDDLDIFELVKKQRAELQQLKVSPDSLYSRYVSLPLSELLALQPELNKAVIEESLALGIDIEDNPVMDLQIEELTTSVEAYKLICNEIKYKVIASYITPKEVI